MTKNMKYRHALRAYEMGCEQVADAFVSQYFPGRDWTWRGDVGGLILVDGYGFELEDAAVMIDLLPHFDSIIDWWKAVVSGESISLRAFLKNAT